MTDRNERCETCRFWRVHGASGVASSVRAAPDKFIGPCQRNPPAHTSVDEKSRWPITHAERWCGEWKAKDLDA